MRGPLVKMFLLLEIAKREEGNEEKIGRSFISGK